MYGTHVVRGVLCVPQRVFYIQTFRDVPLLVGHGYHLDTAVLLHRKLNLNLRLIFLKKKTHPKGYNPP